MAFGEADALELFARGFDDGVDDGLLIGRLGLSFFVVTLASMIAITGVVSLWSNTETTFVDDTLVGNIGMGSILGIATPIWIMAVTLIAGLAMSATALGSILSAPRLGRLADRIGLQHVLAYDRDHARVGKRERVHDDGDRQHAHG